MALKRISLSLLMMVSFIHFLQAQCLAPVVNSFSPSTGFIGSNVTISGINFDPVAANNQVFFGSTKAQVVSSNFSTIVAIVPQGATYAPITVKNGCGLIGQSTLPFNGIFCGSTVSGATYNTVNFSMNVSGGYQMLSQDMDLDGKPDLLVCGFTTNQVSIARNLSTPGSFNFAPKFDLAFSGATRCIAPGDYDGDGKIDLAVVDNGINGIKIYRNTSVPGTLSFTGPISLSAPGSYQLSAGDLNNDGKVDLAASCGNIVMTFRNVSAGAGSISFAANTNINNTFSATGIAIADVDGDGIRDIGTSCPGNDRVTAIRNTTPSGASTFTFGAVQSFLTGSSYPYRLFVGDFDKDGRIDYTTNNFNGATVSVFRNTSSVGSISFAPTVNVASPSSNYRIGVGDADGDGKPDLVTKSSGVNVFSVYVNTSSGPGSISFAARTDYASQAEVSGVVIADLDGDNVPDISTSGTSFNTLRVYRNNSSIVDNTPPTASCKNITVSLDSHGNASITPDMINNGSGDACGIQSLSIDISTFTCANVGENRVVLTVTDRAGNRSTCTSIVTVSPATVSAVGQTTVCAGQTVLLKANLGESYQWLKDGQAIDGATSQTYTATATGNYAVTVTNSGGCSGTSPETSILVNNNPTVSTVPGGTVFLCPPNNSVAITASPSSLYSWTRDGITIGGATGQTYVATAAGRYRVNVVDAFGCSASSDEILVSSAIPEIAITGNGQSITDGDLTPSTSDNTDFGSILPGVSRLVLYEIKNHGASDLKLNALSISGLNAANFSVSGISLPLTIAPGFTATFNVAFTASSIGDYSALVSISNNDCDESVFDFAIKAKIDCAPPSFNTCLADIAAAAPADECAAKVEYVLTLAGNPQPEITYELSGATIANNAMGTGSGSLFNVGTTTVKITASNACGNATCTFNVVVSDAVLPTIISQPDITVFNDPGTCSAILTLADAEATDNCQIASVVNDHPSNIFAVGETLVTWTATDIHGNSAQATQKITVVDNEAPVVPSLPDLTAECGLRAPIPVATDNCAGSVSGTTTDPVTYYEQGSYVITWTFDDGNGNISSQTQNVIIDDVTAPALTSMQAKPAEKVELVRLEEIQKTAASEAPPAAGPAPAPEKQPLESSFQLVVTAQCGTTLSVIPVAFDNCKGIIQGVTTDPLTYNDQGTYLVNWKFDDGNGNILTVTQTVIIDDTVAPVPSLVALPDLHGECSVAITTIPTALDNCSGLINATTTDPVSYTEQGSYSITWKFDDGNGNTTTQTQNIFINDLTPPAPTITTLPALTAECVLTISAPPTATDNCSGTINATTNDPLTYSAQGHYVIHWTYDDGNGNTTSQDQTVTIRDVTSPAISSQADISVPNDVNRCGAIVRFNTPSATDNCSLLSFVRTDNAGLNSGDEFPVGTTMISFKATDIAGNESNLAFNVIVSNTAPVINSVVAPLDPKPINVQIPVIVTFTDNNLVSGQVNWGDGSSGGGAILDNKFTSSHAYTIPGVYTLAIKLSDACGVSVNTLYQYVVVFDPEGGFVTGGGWFTSPPGAYSANPSATGKATFGFVSKYQKGSNVPVGNTDFQFQAANLKFKSSSYDWLVIAGYKAMYKGTGEINGVGGYGFQIAAVDGEKKSSTTPDKIRIKIWSSAGVVYDNQMGSPDDAEASMMIAGGSIVIHDTKSKATEMVSSGSTSLVRESVVAAYPNPFVDEVTIHLNAQVKDNPRMQVLDVTGLPVYDKVHDFSDTGLYSINLEKLNRSGVFILRISQGARTEIVKMVRK